MKKLFVVLLSYDCKIEWDEVVVLCKLLVDDTGFTEEEKREAINKACEISEEGDIVFFSPASASFDMFKNFEERGNKYKEIVNRLGNA